jgi:quinol monooxygenase YgiN
MIQHIVLFKLKPTITATDRQELISRLERLTHQVEGIVRLEIHEDILRLEDSFDLGLFVLLADQASLQRYGESQARQAVSALARSLCVQVILFDYETAKEINDQ